MPWIKPSSAKPAHREIAHFAPGKILGNPEHEAPVLREAVDKREREAGCCRALPGFLDKHYVMAPERQAALQGWSAGA